MPSPPTPPPPPSPSIPSNPHCIFFLYTISFSYRTVLNARPIKRSFKDGQSEEKRAHLLTFLTLFHGWGKKHSAHLEAMKHLFWHFCGILCILLLKNASKTRRKLEKDPFHSNLKQEGLRSVASSSFQQPCITFLFSYKVNGHIMSVFVPLYYFYLQMSYYK